MCPKFLYRIKGHGGRFAQSKAAKSKLQVKLLKHFNQKLRNLTPQEHVEYLGTAKVVPRTETNRPFLRTHRAQPTLEQFIQPPTSVSSEEEEEGTEDVGIATRNFPRYS